MYQYQQQSEKLEIKAQTVIEAQVTTKANADDKVQKLRHDYEFISQEKANLAD